MQSDSPKTREQELEEALRSILQIARIHNGPCSWQHNNSFAEITRLAEALLARPEGKDKP